MGDESTREQEIQERQRDLCVGKNQKSGLYDVKLDLVRCT